MKSRQPIPLSLGATAVATALAFSASSYAADAEKQACNKSENVECQADLSQEAIERIAVHGVKSSVYFYDKSGDKRRVPKVTPA